MDTNCHRVNTWELFFFLKLVVHKIVQLPNAGEGEFLYCITGWVGWGSQTEVFKPAQVFTRMDTTTEQWIQQEKKPEEDHGQMGGPGSSASSMFQNGDSGQRWCSFQVPLLWARIRVYLLILLKHREGPVIYSALRPLFLIGRGEVPFWLGTEDPGNMRPTPYQRRWGATFIPEAPLEATLGRGIRQGHSGKGDREHSLGRPFRRAKWLGKHPGFKILHE